MLWVTDIKYSLTVNVQCDVVRASHTLSHCLLWMYRQICTHIHLHRLLSVIKQHTRLRQMYPLGVFNDV